MKKLCAIIFKSKSENEEYSDLICEKLGTSNLSPNQEFCGIWGEIISNREECLDAISRTVNYFLKSDKSEIYFGCCEKDYNDIIARIDTGLCEVNILSCTAV